MGTMTEDVGRRLAQTCLCLVLAAALPTPSFAQSCPFGGGTAGSRFFGAVDWDYLCSQWPIQVPGTVIGLRYAIEDYTIPGIDVTRPCDPSWPEDWTKDAAEWVTGTEFCDGDLNLIIKPDAGYEWAATNPACAALSAAAASTFPGGPASCSNIINPAADGFPAGTIETEVSTIPGYAEKYFPPGTGVLVEGWWVEDNGHDSKTELHPIRTIWARLPGTGKSAVMMTQDMSGRFDASLWEHNQSFMFNMPLPDSVSIFGTHQPTTSYAPILVEESVLDWYPLPSPFRSTYSRTESQLPQDPHVAIYVTQHSVSLDVIMASLAYGHPYTPFYLGVFQQDSALIFRDSYELSVLQDQGKKYLQLTVHAELLSTAGIAGPLVGSTWKVERSGGSGYDEASSSGAQNSFSFTRTYGPALGQPDHEWLLRATGTSMVPGSLPNAASQDLSHSVSVMKQRRYTIPRSDLISKRETYQQYQQSSGGTIASNCTTDTAVTWTESLVAGIAFTDGPHFVVRTASKHVASLGHAQLGPEVTPAQPFHDQMLTVNLDPQNNHRLRLTWHQFGVRTLIAYGTTELGERISRELDIHSYCRITHELMLKGLIIIRELDRAHLLPAGKPNWKSVFRNHPPVRVAFPRFDEHLDALSSGNPAVSRLFTAAAKFFAHDDLTSEQVRRLSELADAAASVPWKSAPPASFLMDVSSDKSQGRRSATRIVRSAPSRPVMYPSHLVVPWQVDSVAPPPRR